MMIVKECKAKENANDDDVMVVVNHDVPESPTQKCLFACFYETIGVVSQILYQSGKKMAEDELVLSIYFVDQGKSNVDQLIEDFGIDQIQSRRKCNCNNKRTH